MNTLVNMNPWNFLNDLLDMDSRVFRKIEARAAGRFPPVNVFLDDNAIVLDMELPGRTAKDVDLTLEPLAVVISDKPAQAEGAATEAHTAWSRRLELPFRVDADKANAKFTNGILRIELPRAEKTSIRRIAIEG